MITAPFLNSARGVSHAFFTRNGGQSNGVYASLNCGYGSNDSKECVTSNRRWAMSQLGVRADALVTAHQIHSPDAVTVEKPWLPEAAPQADGLATDVPGIALGILTADCAPVLFADDQNGVIGAAHAGWRGALNGVLESTVSAMMRLGANPRSIGAGIGPCIHQQSYEVGPEFQSRFLEIDEKNGDYFRPSGRDDHYFFDLPAFIEGRLEKLKLKAVERTPHDTYAEPSRFFSYRSTIKRGEHDYGRGLSAITLTDKYRGA